MSSLAQKQSPIARARTAEPWRDLVWTEKKVRRFGSTKEIELQPQAVDDIEPYNSWEKYGDNKKTMPRARVFQDFGHIIDLPGPGEYNPRPELLSTEETMPRHKIAVRYPALIVGEKDALSTPSPKYILPSAVQIKDDSQVFQYRMPSHPTNEMRDATPSLVKYSPKHTIDSRYERFTSAVMPKRNRVVLPRTVIDVRTLAVIDQFGKSETLDPGLYNTDIFKKDPRETNMAKTVGTRLNDVHPEGIDYMRPGPGYHEPDRGLLGDRPLGNGICFPSPVKQRTKEIIRSSYKLPSNEGQKVVSGVWVDAKLKRQEFKNTYKSHCSFEKKPLEPRRATGKNMLSTVQDMQHHFKGRQSSGAMRFSPTPKPYNSSKR